MATWAALPQEIMAERIVPMLQNRVKGSARLSCKNWAASIAAGCQRLDVRALDAPPAFEQTFSGIKYLVWKLVENDGGLEALRPLTALEFLDVRF
jgi:hypothetical protein